MRGKREQRIDETKRKISIKMIVLKTLIIALNANLILEIKIEI